MRKLEDHYYSMSEVSFSGAICGGATTTCEVLWMRVLVVTLSGSRHASRVGSSLLPAAGLPEWIANSAEEYITIESGLAYVRSLHGELRQRFSDSSLADTMGFTATYEQAIRGISRRWCHSVDA